MSAALRRRAAAGSGRLRRRRWLVLVTVVAVLLAGFGVATGLMFVAPQQGMPARVDAIVMLNGPGDRLDTTLDLGWARRAPMMVISRGSPYWGQGSICAPKMPGVTVICFDPNPPTTQGEAEFIGRLASRYHWKTVVMVTITPQITPGRVWLARCLPKGTTVYAVAAPLRALMWAPAVVYEWGALIKAELFDRTC